MPTKVIILSPVYTAQDKRGQSLYTISDMVIFVPLIVSGWIEYYYID